MQLVCKLDYIDMKYLSIHYKNIIHAIPWLLDITNTTDDELLTCAKVCCPRLPCLSTHFRRPALEKNHGSIRMLPYLATCTFSAVEKRYLAPTPIIFRSFSFYISIATQKIAYNHSAYINWPSGSSRLVWPSSCSPAVYSTLCTTAHVVQPPAVTV